MLSSVLTVSFNRLLRQWEPKTLSRLAQCPGVMGMGWLRPVVVLSGSDGDEGGLILLFPCYS